jgi:hypothetical protein
MTGPRLGLWLVAPVLLGLLLMHGLQATSTALGLGHSAGHSAVSTDSGHRAGSGSPSMLAAGHATPEIRGASRSTPEQPGSGLLHAGQLCLGLLVLAVLLWLSARVSRVRISVFTWRTGWFPAFAAFLRSRYRPPPVSVYRLAVLRL